MARAEKELALPAIQQLGTVRVLRYLQVMTRYALVVDGGDFLPSGEGVDPLRHRPPHLPGPREVLGWVGVVDGAVVGRSDAALNPFDRVRDIEVLAGEVCDGSVSEVLHPGAERFRTLDAASRVRIECCVRRPDIGLAHEVLRN